MWKELPALRKVLYAVAVAVTAASTAATVVTNQDGAVAGVSATPLESRVQALEQVADSLRIRQDSQSARVGRVEAKLDRIGCWTRALYEGNRSGCVDQ